MSPQQNLNSNYHSSQMSNKVVTVPIPNLGNGTGRPGTTDAVGGNARRIRIKGRNIGVASTFAASPSAQRNSPAAGNKLIGRS